MVSPGGGEGENRNLARDRAVFLVCGLRIVQGSIRRSRVKDERKPLNTVDGEFLCVYLTRISDCTESGYLYISELLHLDPSTRSGQGRGSWASI